MIVELIGAPGAGKTTMIPVVRNVLSRAGYRADTILNHGREFARRTGVGAAVARSTPEWICSRLLWQVFYWHSFLARKSFAGKHPALVEFIRQSQRRRPISPADKRHNLYWITHLTGYYEFLSRHMHTAEGIILDEGFVHRVVQLFASAHENPDPGAVRHYLALVPRPDIVVHIMAPWRVCEARVRRRGLWNRFADRRQEEISGYFQNAHAVVGLAVEEMKSTRWRLVEIANTDRSPERAKQELFEALTAVLAPRVVCRQAASLY